MSRYVTVDTPGGNIIVEVDDSDDVGGINLVGAKGKLPSFEDACKSLKENAKYVLDMMKLLAPDEVEVTCGITVGAEGGNTFWGLAKTSADASYTVKLVWKSESPQLKK